MIKIKLAGDVGAFQKGLKILESELPIAFAEDGIPVHVTKGDKLKAVLTQTEGSIEYAAPAQFFRALSHLAHYGVGCAVEETASFEKNGIMFDVSRNAVLTTESIRYFLRKMSLMGLSLAMMYAEDTYEVEKYPCFGYLRGRYSKDELRGLDDYADALGIEMIPCIQTLGHAERVLQWGAMKPVRDTEDVLLVNEEATYDYLKQIIKDASEPYRSRRIHIGMDEATWIGRGNYLTQKGYRPAVELMKEHFTRVKQIIDEQGLTAWMWSDMFFSICSSSLSMYDGEIPPEVAAVVPEDIGLVYWDYYHRNLDNYQNRLRLHSAFKAETVFAGGIWTWAGPAADYDVTLNTTIPALKACREAGVREVFATAWGDDGGECNALAILYGLQLFAELDYSGEYREAELQERFRFTVGADPQAFLDFSLFHQLPDGNREPMTQNPCKYLFYEDPLVPMLGADMQELPLAAQFADLAEKYRTHAKNAGDVGSFRLLFDFYGKFAEVLSLKCEWRTKAPAAVRGKDRTAAAALDGLAVSLTDSLRTLKETWRDLWFTTNKPYGFEVIDNRVGAQIARMESARFRMAQFAAGKLDTIEELECQKLTSLEADGFVMGRGRWHQIVSACIV